MSIHVRCLFSQLLISATSAGEGRRQGETAATGEMLPSTLGALEVPLTGVPLSFATVVPGLDDDAAPPLVVAQSSILDLNVRGTEQISCSSRGKSGARNPSLHLLLLTRGPTCAAASSMSLRTAVSDQGPARSCAKRVAVALTKRGSCHIRLQGKSGPPSMVGIVGCLHKGVVVSLAHSSPRHVNRPCLPVPAA